MTAAVETRLLQEYLECGQVKILDEASKAALRLCSKQIKDYVDATIIACKVEPCDLDTLLNCNWPLEEVEIFSKDEDNAAEALPASITSLLFDLIQKFPLLKKLLINEIEELPENIGVLSQLKELIINECYELEALPPSFGHLSALERLELVSSGVHLTLNGVGPLEHLNRLKHLKIQGDITSNTLFPEWLCSCDFPFLENLWLGHGLWTFPPNLFNFQHLTTLVLKFNFLRDPEIEVPDSISALSSLRDLTLVSYEGPISLPDLFSKLTTIKELEISSQTHEVDIAPVQHLTGLTRLLLSEFRVEDEVRCYPDFLWNLTLLKTLNLRNCDVRSLPDALGKLKNLELLELRTLSYLQELPESIETLSSLTELEICHCWRLKSLPESIGNLAALKILHLSSCNDLQSLPESFGNLKNMERLKIWGCDILSQLPRSFGSLESLEHFHVGGCENLPGLPDSIGNLNALKVLEIDKCPILHISDSFADLVLGKPYEDWSLQRVSLIGCGGVVFSQKAKEALALLKQHGVWEPED